jgi:serine/threonine protein kinase
LPQSARAGWEKCIAGKIRGWADVAIKVCAQQFTYRFERKARAIAALNHPNICTLHDIGPNYLVKELIEGAPLAGPLPLDVALRHAAQSRSMAASHTLPISYDSKPIGVLRKH